MRLSHYEKWPFTRSWLYDGCQSWFLAGDHSSSSFLIQLREYNKYFQIKPTGEENVDGLLAMISKIAYNDVIKKNKKK